jgi:hypothetical protein
MKLSLHAVIIGFSCLFSGLVGSASAGTGTAFTYQGTLDLQGDPYTGSADFRFALFDAPAGGSQIGPTDTVQVAVERGLFTAAIDFGQGAHGPGRFLQIEVRSPSWDGLGVEPEYFAFTDRTPLTPAPYALQTRGITVDNSGRVGIGTTTPTSSLQVLGGILARGGAPGPFGGFNNGYAFAGNSGDNDSGLFSLANGQVSIFTDAVERFRFSSDGLQFPDGSVQRTAIPAISVFRVVNFGLIPPGLAAAANFSGVTGAATGSAVIVTEVNAENFSPIVLERAFVSSPGVIRVEMRNRSATAVDPLPIEFRIIVIE